MKRIYVAGPYTAEDPRKTQLNVNVAISKGCELMKKGYAPFIPHLFHYIYIHPDGDFNYSTWTKLDMEWLELCEALYLIAPSPGADKEVKKAEEMGIPIYHEMNEVPLACTCASATYA